MLKCELLYQHTDIFIKECFNKTQELLFSMELPPHKFEHPACALECILVCRPLLWCGVCESTDPYFKDGRGSLYSRKLRSLWQWLPFDNLINRPSWLYLQKGVDFLQTFSEIYVRPMGSTPQTVYCYCIYKTGNGTIFTEFWMVGQCSGSESLESS